MTDKPVYRFTDTPTGHHRCEFFLNGVPVSRCVIITKDSEWTITQWFTEECFKHRGYGRTALEALVLHLVDTLEPPLAISYVWNGDNDYVYDFIVKHFNAKCTTPVAVQKYQTEDDWSSHIYALDLNMFMDYFAPDINRDSLESLPSI